MRIETLKPKYSSLKGIRTKYLTFWMSDTPVKKNRLFFTERSRHYNIYGVYLFGKAFCVDVGANW